MMKTLIPKLSILIILGASPAPLQAGTNGFIVPIFRGTAGSQAGYWESFAAASGAPGNPPDKPGASTAAILTQTDPNAFATGSGNLYNSADTSKFILQDSPPFTPGTVVLQTRTVGSELDYASVTLHYTNAAGPQMLAPRPRVELNRGSQPGLGATVSSLWQWDLFGLEARAYAITFQAAAIHLSFDALTLDVSDRFEALFTPPFAVNDPAPDLERWMYPNNSAPCDRPAGSTFATFGDEAGVDTRHAQHLLGWSTAALIPTHRGPASYLIRGARLTLTINRGNLFTCDPTHDDFRTYLATNDAHHLPDPDAGRPVELFGVGFRHGFDAATFGQCSPFGNGEVTGRNAYAMSWFTDGTWIDVSNNVGKTNDAFPPFEAVPFAVGQTTNAAPGEPVPAGAKMTFSLNLADPFVLGYLRTGLNEGRLRFAVSSLHTSSGPAGPPSFPDFATRFNEAVVEPARLELDGVAVGGGDVDGDGLPDDWELFYLQSLAYSGADDADGDGASNQAEYQAGTDPSRSDIAPRLALAARDPAGPVALRFAPAASRRYHLEYTGNLADWQRLTNAPLRYLDAATAQWTDDGTLTGGFGSNRLYRLVIEQP